MVLPRRQGEKPVKKENDIAAQVGNSSCGTPCEATEALARQVADATVRAIEAKWGDSLSKLGLLSRIRTAAVAARRDTAIIISRLDGTPSAAVEGVETCTLKGVRRRQFLRLCELKRSDQETSLRRCAATAIAEIAGPDGYKTVEALVEYAVAHRSWWLARRDGKHECEQDDSSGAAGEVR